jgi:ABC-2 type transport system ATP-binding protein
MPETKKQNKMIKVKNLTKKFNSFTAVDSINFEIGRGEIFAFLGPNGAGKTTTIKMLTTLLRPTSGEIKLNGTNPVSNSQKARKYFGIVFQDPSLDDELTALENMQFHAVLYSVDKNVRKKKIKELLSLVELWDKRDQLVKKFSGGMKRRLEIARGLLHDPEIFFLDEPTLGLDPQTRNRIWEYLRKLNKKSKITIFFTTHYMEEAAKYAQCVAIIDKGRIVAHGTPAQLVKKTGKNTFEAAFIELTGHSIRDEEAGSIDQMRMRRRLYTGRK